MALIELSMIISIILELGAEATIKKLGRREAVINILKRLNLESTPPSDDFTAIYAYTLVEYGVDKPEPVLNFFRNEFIHKAFRKAFYEKAPSILEKEAEGIIEWNRETGQLGRIDYDPRREFASFTAVFNQIIDNLRSPADVKRDQKLDGVFNNTEELIKKLEKINDLDDIRAVLAQLLTSSQLTPPAPEIPFINTELFRDVFSPAEDAFHSMMIKNFLFEYEGEQSDYSELLSDDLRNLFYSIFNKSIRKKTINRLILMGHEGSGKTFNGLLLGLRLVAEGNTVYYCSDVRHTLLKDSFIRSIDEIFDNKYIFLIDNCHTDITKVEDLVEIISKHEKKNDRPNYIFLTRPLDKDTSVDAFGQNIPTIIMYDNLVDFDKLINFFLKKLKSMENPAVFLKKIEESKLSGAFLKYRNMTFWNEAFRSIQSKENISLKEEDIFKRTHLFFQRHEQYLLDLRFDLLKMLPFFAKGISLHLDYVTNVLEISAENAQKLITNRIISIKAQDWEITQYKTDSSLFYTFGLHPTKARILLYIYSKYYKLTVDSEKMIIDYLKTYSQNLYYILSPIYDKDELVSLYKNDEMILLTKEYFKGRPLGKKISRVIKRLSELDEKLKDLLYDSEIIGVFATKINEKWSDIVVKLYLMRSLYKSSPRIAYKVFEKITPAAIIDPFLENSGRRGIYSLSKWMEILKNIYVYADTEEKKEFVRDFVKTILDACSQEFIDRFEEGDIFFSQFHWMLKRLAGLKLSNYFLSKTPPQKLVEFIRTKDINAVELSKSVLPSSKHTFFENESGVECLYYDYIKDHLTYDDIKRIYSNRRTGLYDIAVNAIDPILTNAFVRYVNEDGFKEKVSKETNYLFNKSIGLVQTNYLFSDEDKNLIISMINSAER